MGKGKHFVLVHGACLGAWTWFKIVPLLKSAGHRVTALDLGGCGVNSKRPEEVNAIGDYVEPLMELMASIPEDEKVILVGHAFGGISISLAMETFPEKVVVAVYLAAFMPNYNSPPATLFDELFKQWPMESLSDDQDSPGPIPGNPIVTPILLSPKFIVTKLYQNCQPEDIELTKMLVRPSGFFLDDLSGPSLLTKEKFGSIDRVFIWCGDDKTMSKDFVEWMIENSPTQDVMFIQGADKMAMFSKPTELSLCFQEIADRYE